MESPATTTMRRPCFIGEDDGLASIAEFSGNHKTNNIINHTNYINNNNGFFVNHQNQAYMMRRRNSLRSITSLSTSTSSRALPSPAYSYAVSSPRSARLFDPRFEEFHQPHFLEACSLCKKPLGGNRDIFMYRGDTPFCSEECRQEQIEIDEAKEKEKNWNMKAMRTKKDAKKSSSSSQNYPFHTGTVAAA